MKEGLERSLTVAGAKAAYDEHVKQILARKIVLAHILTGVVPEYLGLKPEEVEPLIEQDPEISMVPVLPGETNLSGVPKVTGINTESKVPNEGTITYDIRFFVWHPDRKRKHKIIIDVEAQKDTPAQYDIVTRGIFYNARQLSAQLDTEFIMPYYRDMKKVYSIWICLNVAKHLENTAVLYDTQPRDLAGFTKNKGRYDLQTVIVINLSKDLVLEEDNLPLHRFLETLLSPKLTLKERTEILETEYGVKPEENWRKGMQQMCNLSEAIHEEGIKEGMWQTTFRTVCNMLKKNKPESEIFELTECSRELFEEAKRQIAEVAGSVSAH